MATPRTPSRFPAPRPSPGVWPVAPFLLITDSISEIGKQPLGEPFIAIPANLIESLRNRCHKAGWEEDRLNGFG